MSTTRPRDRSTWHFLDVRCVWIREVAAILAEEARVMGWMPRLSWTGRFESTSTQYRLEPGVDTIEFPLQRGFARWPLAAVVDESTRIAKRLLAAEPSPARSPLVLCSPHYCDVARAWPGPRIYYATDMFRYCGQARAAVERMERVMCHDVDLVCPNSRRIADYMTMTLNVPAHKILLVPNATRATNLLPECPREASPLPSDLRDLHRPVAGIIGNLSTNTDWLLLEEVVTRTPWLSWVFVGPSSGVVFDQHQLAARTRVMAMGGRVRFVGERPYGALVDYARAFDVAILPYAHLEPTRSGSSTRFYEHLAAARPMLATRGVEELSEKAPLVHLVDTAAEMTAALEALRESGFQDGQEERRWRASRHETIEARVRSIRAGLVERGLVADECADADALEASA
jgi:hypothetical protein